MHKSMCVCIVSMFAAEPTSMKLSENLQIGPTRDYFW